MGVEAGRRCLAAAARRATSRACWRSPPPTPAYADKTNATAIHAALGLADVVPGLRRRRRHPLGRRRGVDGPGRRRAGRARPTSAPAGRGRPTRPTAATPPSRWRSAATASSPRSSARRRCSAEFTDRWRTPGEPSSQLWEERFGEHAYVPLAEQAVTAALKETGIAVDELDHVIVTGAHAACREGRGADDRRPPRGARRRPHRRGRQHRARRTGRCSSPTCSTAPSPASRSPSSCSPTAATCGCCARPTRSPTTGRSRTRPRPRSRRRATTCRTPSSSRGAASCGASRRAGPSPSARPRRRRPAPTTGSTASSAAATRTASSTCRRRGCQHGLGRDRPHGAGAHGRRAGDDRHVHRRPPRLQPEPAGRRGDHRLRRRRPVPVRAHRRRPGRRWRSATASR